MGVNAYCGGQATKASFGAAAVCGDVPVGEVEGQRLGSAARKAAAARGVQAVGWYAQLARRPLSQ